MPHAKGSYGSKMGKPPKKGSAKPKGRKSKKGKY